MATASSEQILNLRHCPRSEHICRTSKLILNSFEPVCMVSAPMISRSVLTLVMIAGPLSALPSDAEAADIGMASFYGKDHVGRKTASGQRFDATALTAAHRT